MAKRYRDPTRRRAERREYQSRNRLKLCSIASCDKPRRGCSKHCYGHGRRKSLWGHPQGRYIRAKEIEPYRKAVRHFLEARQDTPQVQTALALIDAWLSAEVSRPMDERGLHGAIPAHVRLRELVDAVGRDQVAMDILTAGGALFLYSWMSHRSLPDDDRLTQAIGYHALRGGVPFPRKPRYQGRAWKNDEAGSPYFPEQSGGNWSQVPGGQARQHVGRFIRDTLGLLYHRMIEAIEREAVQTHNRTQAQRDALGKSFDVTSDTSADGSSGPSTPPA